MSQWVAGLAVYLSEWSLTSFITRDERGLYPRGLAHSGFLEWTEVPFIAGGWKAPEMQECECYTLISIFFHISAKFNNQLSTRGCKTLLHLVNPWAGKQSCLAVGQGPLPSFTAGDSCIEVAKDDSFETRELHVRHLHLDFGGSWWFFWRLLALPSNLGVFCITTEIKLWFLVPGASEVNIK